jgi:hypothetical protein
LLYRLEEEEEDLEALALPLQEEGEAFNVSLRRLEGKRRREKKRTSRLLLPLGQVAIFVGFSSAAQSGPMSR